MYAYAHEFDNGLKLMEHSYIGNNLVQSIEQVLIDKPSHIIWCGDYSDEVKLTEDEIKQLVKKYKDTEDAKYYSKEELSKKGLTLYSLCEEFDCTKLPSSSKLASNRYKYILNLDTKQFVDKSKVKKVSWGNLRIHPLPLLTCNSNGQGGGDYFNDADKDLVGTWVGNLITLVTKKSDIPKDFTELIVSFTE